MRAAPPRRSGLAVALLLAFPVLLAPDGATAQERGREQEAGSPAAPDVPIRVASAVEPDTVRVGERFRVGITVRAGPSVEVRFPAAIGLGEDLEQRAPAQVREDGAGGIWRAHYEFVAWRTGTVRPASVEIPVTADGREGGVRVTPPAFVVTSVLPEEGEAELRAARPFLERSGWPWPWIAAAAALAAALWWWRRRRADVAAEVERRGPAERTLEALARLRAEWEAGRVEDRVFFDRLESVLRRYGETTRGWSPAATLRSLANGNGSGSLAAVLERSSLVRFARLGPGREAPRRAVSACASWVREDAGLDGGSGSGDAPDRAAVAGRARVGAPPRTSPDNDLGTAPADGDSGTAPADGGSGTAPEEGRP